MNLERILAVYAKERGMSEKGVREGVCQIQMKTKSRSLGGEVSVMMDPKVGSGSGPSAATEMLEPQARFNALEDFRVESSTMCPKAECAEGSNELNTDY